MNKVIIGLVFALMSVTSFAQHRPHGSYGHWQHRHHVYSPGHWMTPLIIGGVAGYAISRAQTPPSTPSVVYVPQGLPPAPAGYHYEQLLDANCNCYRWVITPNT